MLPCLEAGTGGRQGGLRAGEELKGRLALRCSALPGPRASAGHGLLCTRRPLQPRAGHQRTHRRIEVVGRQVRARACCSCHRRHCCIIVCLVPAGLVARPIHQQLARLCGARKQALRGWGERLACRSVGMSLFLAAAWLLHRCASTGLARTAYCLASSLELLAATGGKRRRRSSSQTLLRPSTWG